MEETKKIRGNDQLFEKMYCQIGFNFMKDKMFIPIGLELANTNVYFEHDENFMLKDMTFGYYDPITNSIHVNIDDPFFTHCTDNNAKESKLVFILFHEIMHKILMHTPQRLKNRNPNLWNIAADFEVHNMLYTYIEVSQNIMSLNFNYIKNMMDKCDDMVRNKKQNDSRENPTFMFNKDYMDKIAEEIYEMIENSKEVKRNTFTMNFPMNGNGGEGDGEDDSEGEGNENQQNQQQKNGKKNQQKKNKGVEVEVEEVTYKLPNGQEVKDINVKWPDNESLPKEMQRDLEKDNNSKSLNKSLMENTFAEMTKDDRNAGNMSAACKRFLKKLFHIKIDWEKILRNSLHSILEKADYFAWNKVRTSTFLLPGMSYLPDIVEEETKCGTLIVARDESGSMSDEEIAKAAQIIAEAKEHYQKIVVIKHDTKIGAVKEFEEMDDDVVKFIYTRHSDGGTSHKEVFEYVKKYQEEHTNEEISCFIGITDLYSDVETTQDILPSKIPVIWLTPISAYSKIQGIKGKIIPVEL